MIEHDPIDYSQHEEYLPEHVHEWHFFEESKDGCFCVKGCSSRLSRDKAEDMLNEYETLKAAFTIAIHLLGHTDFKNGNTGPGGVIDEGEVYACRLMDKIKALVPQLYANILEGKDD